MTTVDNKEAARRIERAGESSAKCGPKSRAVVGQHMMVDRLLVDS